MAYTLNTTGLLASYTVKACLVVDEAGTGVQDLVSANSITTHANVTFGTDSWNSVSRKYFATTGASFDPEGVAWNATVPTITAANGFSVFLAAKQVDTAGANPRIYLAGTVGSLRFYSGAAQARMVQNWSGSERLVASSDHLTTTKASYVQLAQRGGNVSAKQAAHGASLASMGDVSEGGWIVTSVDFTNFGGFPGNGWSAMQVFCLLIVEGLLSGTDQDTLHTDWFPNVINAPVTSIKTRRALLGVGI